MEEKPNLVDKKNNVVYQDIEELDSMSAKLAKKRKNTFRILIVTGLLILAGLTVLIAINFNKTHVGSNNTNAHAQTPPTSVSTSSSSSSTSSTIIAALSSLKLSCTANSSGLTTTWVAPSGTPSSYTVNGYISDVTISKQDIYTFNPESTSSLSGTFTWSGNNKDTYYSTAWTQNSNGTKSSIITSNNLDASQCVTTSSSSSTASTTSPSLVCNNFAVTSNGSISTTFQAGSTAPAEIQSGITDSNSSATLNYSNAQWQVSPQDGTLTPSSSGNSATWNIPSSLSGSSPVQYTVSLSGVTDSVGNSLKNPCTVVLTVDPTSTALPNTGTDYPTYILFALGMSILLMGLIYGYYNDLLIVNGFKRRIVKRTRN